MRQAAIIFVRDGDSSIETIPDLPPRHLSAGCGGFPRRLALPGDDRSAALWWIGADCWQDQFHFSDIAQARRSVMAAVREC